MFLSFFFNNIQKLPIEVRTQSTLFPTVIRSCLPTHQLLVGPLGPCAYHLLIILHFFLCLSQSIIFYCFLK